MKKSIPATLHEIAEELHYLEHLLSDAEKRMLSPQTHPAERFAYHANYFAWVGAYKSTLRLLFDTCQQISKSSRNLTNVRHIQVYQMERHALKELRQLYLRIN